MKVTLKVDHREGKLKELFAAAKVDDVTYENLEHGDFQLLADGQIKFILERKTLDDLIASVKDGRYTNQKARLLQLYQPSQLFYIIEGSVAWSLSQEHTQTKIIQSAVINTMMRDKIATFNTKNVTETFDLIRGIYARLREDPDKYLNPEPLREQSLVSTSKDATPQQVFKGILCQVPGVSDKSAGAIQQHFAILPQLYAELSPLTADKQLERLQDIKVNNRKISKKIVEGIVKHLLPVSTLSGNTK